MVVSELITELQGLPQDAWCDALFPNGEAAFTVAGVETLELPDGRVYAIVNIIDEVPLQAV